MIKIIAMLTNAIGSGGGFNQSVNAILQLQRLSAERFNFEVFTTNSNNLVYLEQLNVEATLVNISIFDKALAKVAHNSSWQFLQSRLNLIGPLEKKLIKHGCDMVYYITPDSQSAGLQKLNYITTVWDLCHRESPEFPEVRNYNSFSIREKHYKTNLGPAFLVITDSERLSKLAAHYYGVDYSRFLVMPFAQSPFIEEYYSLSDKEVKHKYMLEPGYFFYPAQFWAHKNHIRILQALIHLKEHNGWVPKVVFSGKDHGNLARIENFIQVNKLESQVEIIGFVPPEDMRALYVNAMAVVMPTYFGPTNLPPIEAWSIGKPLIYSAHLAEQCGDAALLVNPDDAVELAEAMFLCTSQDVCARLIKAGKVRLKQVGLQRADAEEKLCAAIDRFAIRRQTWDE